MTTTTSSDGNVIGAVHRSGGGTVFGPQPTSNADITAAIAALVAGAPGALDTLNELSAALGNDASFATTVTNALAAKAPIASPTLTGIATSPVYKATGLTGAVAASRYVGGTASGAPASGTFLVGDFIIDQTAKIYICTVAGTPGTWVNASGSTPVVARYDSGNSNNGFDVLTAIPTFAPWAVKASQTGLLSLTVPTEPTVLANGLYLVAATIIADSTPAENVQVTMHLSPDSSSPAGNAQSYGVLRGGTNNGPITIVACNYMLAGDDIYVNVTTAEAGTATFYLDAVVSKIA